MECGTQGLINALRGMVTVRSDDRLIDYLTLVRDRQTVLRGQFAELFMRGAHSYWIRMIINNWEGCQRDFLLDFETVQHWPRPL